MFCPNCGTELPDYARFCTNCGADVAEKFSEQLTKKTPAADPDETPEPVKASADKIEVTAESAGTGKAAEVAEAAEAIVPNEEPEEAEADEDAEEKEQAEDSEAETTDTAEVTEEAEVSNIEQTENVSAARPESNEEATTTSIEITEEAPVTLTEATEDASGSSESAVEVRGGIREQISNAFANARRYIPLPILVLLLALAISGTAYAVYYVWENVILPAIEQAQTPQEETEIVEEGSAEGSANPETQELDEEDESETGEDPEAEALALYMPVLQECYEFVSNTPSSLEEVFSNGTFKYSFMDGRYLDSYSRWQAANEDARYAFIDLNKDGVLELIVYDAYDHYYTLVDNKPVMCILSDIRFRGVFTTNGFIVNSGSGGMSYGWQVEALKPSEEITPEDLKYGRLTTPVESLSLDRYNGAETYTHTVGDMTEEVDESYVDELWAKYPPLDLSVETKDVTWHFFKDFESLKPDATEKSDSINALSLNDVRRQAIGLSFARAFYGPNYVDGAETSPGGMRTAHIVGVEDWAVKCRSYTSPSSNLYESFTPKEYEGEMWTPEHLEWLEDNGGFWSYYYFVFCVFNSAEVIAQSEDSLTMRCTFFSGNGSLPPNYQEVSTPASEKLTLYFDGENKITEIEMSDFEYGSYWRTD